MTGNVEIDPVKYGAMWQQVQAMDKKIDKLEIQVEKMGEQIAQLVEMANKSKGGLWVAMAIVGGLTTLGLGFLSFLKGQ